jgi:hypothetical protein
MPEPPKPPRQASRPSIEVDAVVGAARERAASDDHVRPELARRSQTLNGMGAVKASPPIPPAPSLPLEHARTKPAPAPYQAGPTKPAPSAALPFPEGHRSPYEPQPQPSDGPVPVAPDTLHGPRRKGEIERDRRATAEAQQETFPPKVVESSRPPAKTPPKATAAYEDPSPRAWKAALFKLLVAAGAFLTAATAYLSLRTAAVEPKVAAQEVRVKAAETTQDTLVDRVAKLEAFARAETKRRQCVEAQLRDALARGTGHVLTTLPATPTPWSEQNAPRAEPRLLWKTPTWFTTEGCDAAPAPP